MDSIYAVYIGTTKIVGIRGHVDKKENLVVETLVKVPALGFEKGIVVDLEKASHQVKEVILKLARESELGRIHFYVILSNNLIKMFSSSSSLFFGDNSKSIAQTDIDRVIDQTRGTATIPLSETIVLTLPQEFTINDLSGIKNPLDLDARRLAVNLLLFTVDADVFKNINRVFDRLELSCEAFVPRIVTSSFSVLRPEEKRDGVALIDIGGYTTSISYYHNQVLGGYEVLPFGGETISDYLSINLGISLLEARRLKEQFGSTILLERFEDEIIPVVDVFGKTKFNINKKRLFDQINIAARGLAEKIQAAINANQKQGHQVCGIVVTGGGAKLDGFLDILQKSLGLTVRLGVARNVSGHSDALTNPAFASQLGLLGYLADQTHRKRLKYQGKNILTQKMIWMREWIQENF